MSGRCGWGRGNNSGLLWGPPQPDHGRRPRPRADHGAATFPTSTARALLPLTLTTIGVVYGDIGTSPLYTIRECFFGTHSVPPTPENVLGVLSLVIYALVIVISIKYIAIVMRADNAGRGRHPRADGAPARARQREWQARVDRSRHFRRGAAVWRRHDHAGHHRARRRRGTEGRDAVVRFVRGADRRRDSHRDLRDPAARHASGRPTVWSGDGAVVHHDRGPRADLDRQEADRPVRDQPGPRPRLLRDARAARLRGTGRGVSGGHRRRGAVRRHGPLREAADSPRVVQPGAARPVAQLLRSGRAAADRQHRGGTALLPAGAVLGAPAHGGAGDGGRHHRLPGTHLRRLLADPPGRPAWLQPADGHRPHLVAPHGADLRAAGELGADGRARSPSSSGSGRRARSRPHTASPSR